MAVLIGGATTVLIGGTMTVLIGGATAVLIGRSMAMPDFLRLLMDHCLTFSLLYTRTEGS